MSVIKNYRHSGILFLLFGLQYYVLAAVTIC